MNCHSRFVIEFKCGPVMWIEADAGQSKARVISYFCIETHKISEEGERRVGNVVFPFEL